MVVVKNCQNIFTIPSTTLKNLLSSQQFYNYLYKKIATTLKDSRLPIMYHHLPLLGI